MVDYGKQWGRDFAPDSPAKNGGRRNMDETDSDTDFQARGGESDGEDSAEDVADNISVHEAEQKPRNRSTIIETHSHSQDTSKQETSHQLYSTEPVPAARSFKRVNISIPQVLYPDGIFDGRPPPVGSIQQHAGSLERQGDPRFAISPPCLACNARHARGSCPIKQAGVEFCGLCGIAHYGSGLPKTCPHLNSITQCRIMLETLKSSSEPKEHIEAAKRYVVGVIARLKQKKKLKKSNASRPLTALQPSEPSVRNQHAAGPSEAMPKGSSTSYASPYMIDANMMNDK